MAKEAATRGHVVLTGGEVSVLIGLLDVAAPELSKELRAVALEYSHRLDERGVEMTPPETGASAVNRARARRTRAAYQELRASYLMLQKRTEAALQAARVVNIENTALRGVVRKAVTLIGRAGPVPAIEPTDELLVSLRADLDKYAA